MHSAKTPSSAQPVDEGLFCLACEYNLTGIASPRCPECGTEIDWQVVRQIRDQERSRPGTWWDRWPWYLKPAGFVATAIEVALLPWVFARRLPARPRLIWALAFLALCMAGGMLAAALTQNDGLEMWGIGVGCHVLLQSLAFGLILRPTRVRHPIRFWTAVTAYTSYPLLLEGFEAPPFILWEESNVFPFCLWRHLTSGAPILTNVLFYLWWIDLGVIAAVRVPRRRWRRIMLMMLAIPVLTFVSSYAGCYLGDALD